MIFPFNGKPVPKPVPNLWCLGRLGSTSGNDEYCKKSWEVNELGVERGWEQRPQPGLLFNLGGAVSLQRLSCVTAVPVSCLSHPPLQICLRARRSDCKERSELQQGKKGIEWVEIHV